TTNPVSTGLIFVIPSNETHCCRKYSAVDTRPPNVTRQPTPYQPHVDVKQQKLREHLRAFSF
ncbi:MAG: hypothetical protein ABS976_16780, partial [Rhodococcus sp. (in: high G+C Gram-positive bacteria)]